MQSCRERDTFSFPALCTLHFALSKGMTGIDGSSFHGMQSEDVRHLVKSRAKNKCKLAQPGEECVRESVRSFVRSGSRVTLEPIRPVDVR